MIARNVWNRAVLPSDQTHELTRELRNRVAHLVGSAEKKTTTIPRLTMHQWRAPTDAGPVVYEPSVIVIAQGRKEAQLGTCTLTNDSSHYLLTSINLPSVARVVQASADTPCLAVSLKLNFSIIREFLSKEEIPIPDVTTDGRAMSVVPVTEDFLSAWCRLLDLMSNPEDIPFLGELIEGELMYRILSGPEGARLRAIVTPGHHSYRTAKAIAWINANYSAPLRVEELARLADMAVSTFHHHFRALTATSPLQYQKHIRLQAARARLLAHDVDAATVAFEVGYESASQFNREYSRVFGQPPIQDVRKMRLPCVRRVEPLPTVYPRKRK